VGSGNCARQPDRRAAASDEQVATDNKEASAERDNKEASAERLLDSEITESQHTRGRASAPALTQTAAGGAVLAYVHAQCSARSLGSADECWQPLLQQHAVVALSSPIVLWHTVSDSFWPASAEASAQVLPTAQEALNALGGCVGVLLLHELLRQTFVWLVWASRRSDTTWGDVLFGCGACGFVLDASCQVACDPAD
jgi:hypothetical protein